MFYYAHTATVFINKMLAAGLIAERVNRDFEVICTTSLPSLPLLRFTWWRQCHPHMFFMLTTYH